MDYGPLMRLIVTHIVGRFPTLYGTGIFIAVFARARHWGLLRFGSI
jgi:hypothetical protein